MPISLRDCSAVVTVVAVLLQLPQLQLQPQLRFRQQVTNSHYEFISFIKNKKAAVIVLISGAITSIL